MYSNLKSLMDKYNVTQTKVADILGLHINSVHNKIYGDSSFSIEEAFKIKEYFFQAYELNYLFKFEPTQDQQSA